MITKHNRALDVKSNVLEVNAQTEKKNAWIKVMVSEGFAQALIRDWMGSELEKEESITDVQIVWNDKEGLTFTPANKSLRDLLREDIIERYDHPEYHGPYDEDEEVSAEYSTNDILGRYDNSEYWAKDIVMDYLYEDYISEEDMELIRWMLPDDEIAVALLAQKGELC